MDPSTFFNAAWFDKLAGTSAFREAILRPSAEVHTGGGRANTGELGEGSGSV